MPEHEKLLQETYRLAKDNNVMLHKMRRSAFIGRLVTVLFYLALILGPVWFYQKYLSGTVDQVMNGYQKMQTSGNQFQQAIQQFQQKIQSFTSTSSSSSTQ